MIDLAAPLVINAALTGIVPRRADNPSVPLSPGEIAQDARRCFLAGARTFHMHAREVDGSPSARKEVYAEIFRLVRLEVPDSVVCASTSGRVHVTFEERSDVLSLEGDLKPDLASLTLGSMNFATQASVNDPAMIARLAERMAERGIVPEMEVFDLGMLDHAGRLIDKGIVRPPFVFNLILGNAGTLGATGRNLTLLVDRLPPGSFWSAGGIGRHQLPMNALAVTLGGHVRTGLEDSLYMDAARREPATNAGLVERIAGVARSVGRPLATPSEARRRMGLAA